MKFFTAFAVAFCLAVCLATQSTALPAADANAGNALKVLELNVLGRHKRATCDLLSGFGVQHSACAGHCLLRGKGGGHCNAEGVCECRN